MPRPTINSSPYPPRPILNKQTNKRETPQPRGGVAVVLLSLESPRSGTVRGSQLCEEAVGATLACAHGSIVSQQSHKSPPGQEPGDQSRVTQTGSKQKSPFSVRVVCVKLGDTC